MTVRRPLGCLTRRSVLAGLALSVSPPVRAAGGLTVLAAASLKPALDEIATTWAEPVALSYGGSGTIARQAAAGAPADLVLLAASDWMEWLVGQGVVQGTARSVASNRLVMAGPAGAGQIELTSDGVEGRLGTEGRFAMGDPLSVPAGRYGQQALETLGLWTALRPRAILAENVRAALAYVARGDVTLGLVYASDVVGTGAVDVARIPARAHQPIVYPGAVLAGAAPSARALLDHIAQATDVFARHGFHL
ncbi:molybdate ABC transporter substrate-binding protein [Jannaschia pagri]|uniref:Molybdate ABC transporter substrate-binding protein n=1 Tax=Jannaschia pagri TaxID=2829797 RepID=A0ABQ4NP79_9RHOB|nr:MULTISPECIES: molybdate ABC transporter substrate-binding protein [unclassified Jannaschia]GIT92316.1 molybdate ABC transporter substrate-binding protein [Jannaschia sp. AI_61]GIT96151.1 molybdate ABC transporter substrate-binding protein [Jannaschia sp. AI_62]